MTGKPANSQQDYSSLPDGLKYLLIALLVLGIFFRFANLEQKVYWGDEVFTSFRIAGYTLTEVTQEVFDGKVKSLEALQEYQRPHPERGLSHTIKSLAIEDSQHPPLYYIIAWFWEKAFGSTVAVKRSLPALISLLVFPCLYSLCRELFVTPIVAWVAVALVAISPFHVLYAQEVREYSLWTVTILLSSWALLKARRVNTKISWGIYAITLALALYTYLFSILIAIGHAIYIFAIDKKFKFKFTRTKSEINTEPNSTLKSFLVASIFGFISFTPWLFFVATNISTIQSTTSLLKQKVALPSLVEVWAINLSRVFLDLDSQGNIIDLGNGLTNIIRIPVIIMLSILVGYSIYYLCYHSSKHIWLFILTLAGVTGLALILPDLMLGGIRSSATRYLVPCYLGIQLAVAYTLSGWMGYLPLPSSKPVGANPCVSPPHPFKKGRVFWQQIGRFVMIALVSGGILSCAMSSQAESWWNKYGSYHNPQIARIINQEPRPLVMASAYVPRVFSLSYLLEPKVQIQFVTAANLSGTPEGFSEVFLYRPSEELKFRLETQLNYKVERVYQSPPIYQYLKPISQQAQIWIERVRQR